MFPVCWVVDREFVAKGALTALQQAGIKIGYSFTSPPHPLYDRNCGYRIKRH